MAYIAHGVIVGFKLTNNKITEITYKEKCFLEFTSLGSGSLYKKRVPVTCFFSSH